MKFLCEHCKAKYQIADDKVAGRTVKMKCRKCGNPIEVRAAVTETSVNTRIPQEPAPGPGGGPPAKPRVPAPRAGLATSLSTARPTAARPQPAPPKPQQDGALAGAFQRTVQREEEISVALDLRELSAADEWYVAINGVPVGPVRVAEVRRKAALGVVTEDSLVWQEGMEEWRPVRAVSELAAAVREAAAGGRVSLMAPPNEGRTSAPPPAVRTASTRPAAPRAPVMKPAPPHAPAAVRSNVVPITSRLATAERLDAEDGTLVEPSPFVSPPMAPMVAPDPFAAPPAVSAVSAPIVPPGPAPLLVAPAPVTTFGGQKKSPPWIVIAMLVLALAFGITAAILIFKPQPPAPQVVVTMPSALAPVPAAAVPTDSVIPAPADTTSNPTVSTGPAKSGSVARNGAAAGSAHGAAAPIDPSLQDLIKGAAGPSTGPSPTTGGGNSSALDPAQAERVVSQHKIGVTRTCWERSSSTVANANVDVKITVASSGAVTGAQATGNDLVIAHCIENAVRSWNFGPSAGTSTITVPFRFVRQ